MTPLNPTVMNSLGTAELFLVGFGELHDLLATRSLPQDSHCVKLGLLFMNCTKEQVSEWILPSPAVAKGSLCMMDGQYKSHFPLCTPHYL